jgi:hypothetical protein
LRLKKASANLDILSKNEQFALKFAIGGVWQEIGGDVFPIFLLMKVAFCYCKVSKYLSSC